MTPSPLLAALLSAVSPCTVTTQDELAFDAPVVRLSDVVTLDCIDEAARDRVGGQSLVELSERPDIRLSRAAIASLARRRVPLLRFGENQQGDVHLRLRTPRQSAPAAHTCLRVLRPIDADTIFVSDMVTLAPCSDVLADAPIMRDAASGFARASDEIEADSIIPHVLVAPVTRTRKGDRLTLVVESGPVTITRPVEALQDGGAGERLFVRDADGEIFSMPLAETAP